jgi:hypothetical protein
VYFAPFDTHLQGVYDYVLKHGEASAGDKYQLVASSDVSAVKDASIINFQVRIFHFFFLFFFFLL